MPVSSKQKKESKKKERNLIFGKEEIYQNVLSKMDFGGNWNKNRCKKHNFFNKVFQGQPHKHALSLCLYIIIKH